MSYGVYWLMHIASLLLLFMALGAMLLGSPKGEKPPRIATILHGIALLVMLVAGMGLIARRELQGDGYDFYWPLWIWAKLGIWILLGAFPIFVRKDWIPRPIAWVVALGLAMTAGWLVLNRPWQ